MQLRWSFAIVSLSSFVYTSLAIPIPGGKDDPKASSSTYRKNAESAPTDFQRTPGGVNLNAVPNQGPRLPRPFEDADHLLEAQTLHRALRDQNLQYANLPMHHRSGLREILNHPSNMAFIDRSLNRGKGQVVRHGQDGRQLTTANPSRDSYIRAQIPNAHQTATRLDTFLTQHGYQGNVAQTHRNTMEAAGHLTPGRPIPAPGHHGPNQLANQLGNLNIHGHGSGSSSGGSGHSTPSPSPPHSPSPAGRPGAHGNHPPSTPPRRNGPDPRLGTHAPARVNRANERYANIGPIAPIPSFHDLQQRRAGHVTPPSTPHHGNAQAGPSHQPPSTPAHQTGSNHQQHAPGHNPPRRNSFSGTPAVTRSMVTRSMAAAQNVKGKGKA